MRTDQEVADRMWWFFAAGWFLALGVERFADHRVFDVRTGFICLAGWGVLRLAGNPLPPLVQSSWSEIEGAGVSTDAFSEIQELLPKLSPRKFASRLAYWRRGSLPAGGLSERVGGSREAKRPQFDKTDQRINQAEFDYNEAIDSFVAAMAESDHKAALGHLRTAETLERIWLVKIDRLDAEQLKQIDALVSDAASCRTCEITKEAWLHKQRQEGRKRSIFRLKGGDCAACYQAKYRARVAELEVIDPEQVAS